MIFSRNKRKIEAYRRFGSRSFRDKIREAQNYKRSFGANQRSWDFLNMTPSLKMWRNIAIVAIIIIIYYLFISSRFVVSQVEVRGNKDVSTESIQDALKSVRNARLFFLSQGRVNNILVSALPSIKEVTEFDRDWPSKIIVTVKERNPGFVIKSNESYFLIDDEGVAVDQIDGPKDYLVLEDQMVESFATNEPLPNPKLAPFVVSMARQWPTKINIAMTKMKFPGKGSTEVQFETVEGWSVLFDTGRSVNSQLSSLSIILNRQIPVADRSRLAYIDLRLSKFAYYCYKASACEQHEQIAGTATNNEEKQPEQE